MLRYIAVIAACAAMPAQARNWVYVGMTDSRSTAYFIDKDSIDQGEDGAVAATAFSVHSKDNPRNGSASTVLSLEFDCTAPRYRFRHLTGYDAGIKQRFDEVGSGTWRDVSAGSLDAAARTFVCSRGHQNALNQAYGASLAATFAEGRRRLGTE